MADTTTEDNAYEGVHFDDLWATALEALELYASKTWTATGDHDPGIALLQALTYGVADIAYRHTLPLKDLLAPGTAATNLAGSATVPPATVPPTPVFAATFGPDWALTTGPVTQEDWRKAVIDTLPYGMPVDVIKAVRVSNAPSRQYVFDEDYYVIKFSYGDTGAEPKNTFSVPGGSDVKVPLAAADFSDGLLSKLLSENRLLGEPSMTLTPLDAPALTRIELPAITITLSAQVPGDAPENAIAAILWAMESWCSTLPTVATPRDRLLSGEDIESIYDGPRLTRGKVENTTGSVHSGSRTWADLCTFVETSPYVESAVVQIGNSPPPPPGLFHVLKREGNKWSISQDNLRVMKNRASGASVQYDQASWQAPLNTYVQGLDAESRAHTNEWAAQSPSGQYRHPGWYRSVGELLPSVFGLQKDDLIADYSAANLLRFLRPFEQWLADAADQLEKLPTLLSFEHRNSDNAVWGASPWPASGHDPVVFAQSEQVLTQPVMKALAQHVKENSGDKKKEIAILNYLMAYFGETPSLDNAAEGDLAAQIAGKRRWLANAAKKGYFRARGCDSATGMLETIELLLDIKAGTNGQNILLIDNSDLLPVWPTRAQLDSIKWTSITFDSTAAFDDANNKVFLKLPEGQRDASSSSLVTQGSVIDLGFDNLFAGVGVIRAVSGSVVTAEMSPEGLQRLKRYSENKNLLMWRVSQTWLSRHNYSHKDDLSNDQIQLTNLIPDEIQASASVLLRPHDAWSESSTRGGQGPNAVGTVKEVQAEKNSFTASLVVTNLPPSNEAMDQWGLGIPYKNDVFSLASTLAINSTRVGTQERGEYEKRIAKVLRERLPSHIHVYTRWCSGDQFTRLSTSHTAWLAGKKIFGNDAYELLSILGIGQRPEAVEKNPFGPPSA